MTRTSKLLVVPIGLLSLAFFLTVARNRLIDPDEGYYILASRLVFQHKMPYRDFLYTQTPLLPYVYGLWMQLGGISWASARSLSVGFTDVLSILLYIQISSQTRRWAVGVLGVLLFASSTLIFGWMPIVKTYALSSVLLFSCYMIVTRFSAGSPRWLFSVAGLLLGLSVEVRLYFIGLLPIFLLWVFRNREICRKRAALFCFTAGFLIAILPSAYFAIFHWNVFLFNIIGIHAIRSDYDLIGSLGQKLWTFLGALLVGRTGNGFQLGVLLLISLVLIGKKTMTDAGRLAFQIAIALGFICFLPTPTYVQYLSVIIPFLIMCVAYSLPSLFTSWDGKRRPKVVFALICTMLIYLAIPVTDYTRYFGVGPHTIIPSPSESRADREIERVRMVSRTIKALVHPGETVVSFWPGYIVESTATPYSGLECDTGITFSAKLSPEQLAAYHIASRGQIEDAIRSRIPRIVVLGNQEYWQQSRQPYIRVLASAGYVVARQIGGAFVYLKSDVTAAHSVNGSTQTTIRPTAHYGMS